MRTTRDLDITTTAYLKSIIESGAEQKDWEPLLLAALKLHFRAVATLEVQKTMKRETTKNG